MNTIIRLVTVIIPSTNPGVPLPPPPEPTFHLNFDGVNDKVTIPHAASINNLPLGDFTVEFSAQLPNSDGAVYTKTRDVGGWQSGLEVFRFGGVSGFGGLSILLTSGDYTGWIQAIIDIDEELHNFEIDFIKGSPSSVKIFVDGVEGTYHVESWLGNNDYDTYLYDNDASIDATVFSYPDDTSLKNGRLNYLRISNIASHSSNFTPPDLFVCPPADANTVLRLALDEGTGTLVEDTSGNNNNGTIDGATWEAD